MSAITRESFKGLASSLQGAHDWMLGIPPSGTPKGESGTARTTVEVGGHTRLVLRVYSWLCPEISLLVGFREQDRVTGIELRLASCKARFLDIVLFLGSHLSPSCHYTQFS